MWNGRVGSWHEHVNDSEAFDEIRRSVVLAARVTEADRVVDLGAGTGFVTFALAPWAAHVLAVDLSNEMLGELSAAAKARSLANVEVLRSDLATLELAPRSVDLIVTSYALHHLKDSEKVALIDRAQIWLRPGGRIVIADMMFGRGGSSTDRAIIRQKVRALLRKGPGGAWRVAKNIVRFGLRIGTELPASPTFWCDTFGRLRRRHVLRYSGRSRVGDGPKSLNSAVERRTRPMLHRTSVPSRVTAWKRSAATLPLAAFWFALPPSPPIPRTFASAVVRSDAIRVPLGAMAEVAIAADPARPTELTVAADPYLPTVRIRIATSHDRGLTWGAPIDLIPPGYSKSYDPTVSYRRDGAVVVVGGASSIGLPNCQTNSAIFAATMTTTGVQYAIVAGPKPLTYYDRPSSTIDSRNDRTIVTWTESTGAGAECKGVPTRSRLMLSTGSDRTYDTPIAVPSSGLRAPFGSSAVVDSAGSLTVAGAEHQTGHPSRLVVSRSTTQSLDLGRPSTLRHGPPLTPRLAGVGGFNAPVPVTAAGPTGEIAVAWLLQEHSGTAIVIYLRNKQGTWQDVSPPPSIVASPRLAQITFSAIGQLALLVAGYETGRLNYVIALRGSEWTAPLQLATTKAAQFNEIGETLGLVSSDDQLSAVVPLDDATGGTAAVFNIPISAISANSVFPPPLAPRAEPAEARG